MQQRISPVVSTAFEQDVLDASMSLAVLLYIGADNCAPCRLQWPVLQRLQSEFAQQLRVVSIDADQQADICLRLQVRSVPSLLVFKDRQLVQQCSGLQSEQALRQWLQPWCASECDALYQEGQDRLAKGELDDAAHTFERAWKTAHQQGLWRPQLFVAWLETLLQARKVDAAAHAFDKYGACLHREPEVIQVRAQLALQTYGCKTAVIAVALALAREQQYRQALDQLMALVQSSDHAAAAREAIFMILNAVPDRQLANQYRRQMHQLEL